MPVGRSTEPGRPRAASWATGPTSPARISSQTLESNSNQLGHSLWVRQAPAATLLDLRRLRLRNWSRTSAASWKWTAPAIRRVRGRLVALDPDPRLPCSWPQRAGFTIIATEHDPVIGVNLVVLGAPRGLTTRRR